MNSIRAQVGGWLGSLSLLAFLLLVFYSLFDPMLVLTDTHVAGGDMISHPAIPHALKSQWSQGRFWSWNHSWFGGIPFLYFYFYPIYLLTIIFELIGFSPAQAFKVMVLFVVTMVPVGYWLFGRRWLTRAQTFFFSSLGLAIFLNEFDSRWGGNFKSLLAGQVSHQLGIMALVALFSFLQKNQLRSPWAAFWFGLCILCHAYTGFFAGLMVGFYLVWRFFDLRSPKQWLSELTGPALGVGLAAFFWIPFFYFRNGTVAPKNNWVITKEEFWRVLQVQNPLYAALYLAGLVSLLFLLWKRKNICQGVWIFMLLLFTVALIPLSEGTPILHIRIPPQVYLFSVFLLMSNIRDLAIEESWHWPVFGMAGLLVLQSFVPSSQLDRVLPQAVRAPVADLPHWWRWNMSGIETKHNSQDVFSVWKYLREAEDSEARVAVEYGDYNSFGSPRIFEMTPVMTGKPIIEGLLLESSPTYPIYYYNSMKINITTWWPGFPVTVPTIDVKKGIEYFALFNVKFFVAGSRATKDQMKLDGFKVLFENPSFTVFAVNPTTRIANRLEGEVPEITSSQPLLQSVLNLPESVDRHVVVHPGKQYLKDGIKSASPVEQKLVSLEGNWSADQQAFEVEETGAKQGSPQNILFKIPYFPNWRASTGEPVKIVSPNLMLVRTESPKLTLRFQVGWIERFAGAVSALCFLVFTVWVIRRQRSRQKVVSRSF